MTITFGPDFMGLFGALDSNGGGDGTTTPPTTGGNDPGTGTGTPPDPTLQYGYWQFPQYTQRWAFTPPTPSPYSQPQPFDYNKYGSPFSKKNK